MGDQDRHPPNCEKAEGDVCKCGCSGLKHGIRGGIDSARETQAERDAQRVEIKEKLDLWVDPPLPKPTKTNRHLVTRICKVDIADEIASTGYMNSSSNTKDRESESLPGPDTGQIEIVARELTERLWPEVRATIERESTKEGLDPEKVKEALANHAWCDLFVGLILVIEKAQGALDSVKDTAHDLIVKAIVDSSRHRFRGYLTDQIVSVIVKKVWSSFEVGVAHLFPIYGLVRSENLLRTLRILTVFICPSPAAHEEVKEHALKPLGDDARGYISGETKEYLNAVFEDWLKSSDGGDGPSDRAA